MTPPIFPLAIASPAVLALVGGPLVRVYRSGRAQQDVKPPYVTWSVISDAPESDLDGGGVVHCRVQVNCFATDEDDCDALDSAMARAIENDGENVNLGLSVDGVDEGTNLFRKSRDFSLWLPLE